MEHGADRTEPPGPEVGDRRLLDLVYRELRRLAESRLAPLGGNGVKVQTV